MGASERLKTAGEAAELLEEMGYVSVARLCDGVVTLECWERTRVSGRMIRQIVDDEAITKRLLAETCAAAFRGATPDAS